MPHNLAVLLRGIFMFSQFLVGFSQGTATHIPKTCTLGSPKTSNFPQLEIWVKICPVICWQSVRDVPGLSCKGKQVEGQACFWCLPLPTHPFQMIGLLGACWSKTGWAPLMQSNNKQKKPNKKTVFCQSVSTRGPPRLRNISLQMRISFRQLAKPLRSEDSHVS